MFENTAHERGVINFFHELPDEFKFIAADYRAPSVGLGLI